MPSQHKAPSAELLLRNSNQRQALLGEGAASSHHRSPDFAAPAPSAGHGAGNQEQDPALRELQQQGLVKSQETTSTMWNCLRVAEDMKQQATQTIVQLHEQGQQIRRTHETALVLEQELNKGEKLLASLGGLFSMPWRPKRGHELHGPVDSHTENTPSVHAAPRPEERNALIDEHRTSYSNSSPLHQVPEFQLHVQGEKLKQDGALSDLSNVLDQLKEMSVSMGHELRSQNQSLGRLHDDVSELEFRVKNANEREQQLLRR